MQIASSAYRLLGIVAILGEVFCGCNNGLVSNGSGVGGAQNADTSADAGGANGGSNSGGSSADCPTWPRSKLFPYVGPMFYGPDPGPCSSTHKTVGQLPFSYEYVYSDSGNLLEQVHSETKTIAAIYTYDEQGNLMEMGSPSELYNISYSESCVSSSLDTFDRGYYLDRLGYPISEITRNNINYTILSTTEFTYDSCRLTALIHKDADGVVSQSGSFSEITYDDRGHLIRQVSVDRSQTVTYDYSCW